VEFMAEVSAFDPNMLIWIDETGSDRRNEIRKYGMFAGPLAFHQQPITTVHLLQVFPP